VKKALLIAAGTVTGLGAVLSITPPALSESVGSVGITGGSDLGAAAAPAQSVATPATSTPTPSKSVTSATPTPSAMQRLLQRLQQRLHQRLHRLRALRQQVQAEHL